LKNIEAHIFSTLPASVDLDGLDDKIQAVRSARTDMAKDINVDPDKQSVYEAALKDLLDFHHDQFGKAESYTFPLSLIKSDQALSPRGIAKIAAASHGRDRSGNAPKSVDTLVDESVKNFRDKTPRINDILSALGSEWQAQGAKEYHDELTSKLSKEYSDLGLPRAEADFRSKVRASNMLNNQAGNPALAQVKVSSSSANADILVYMNDNGDGTLTPSLSGAQAKYVNDAIAKSRAFRFNKDKTAVHALGSSTYLPPAVASTIGDSDAAFTYFGGNGVYLYPDRVSGILGKLPNDPKFYSTDIKTEADAFNHIIVHETGHIQMYKLWGDDKNSGRAALAADMAKLNVPQDVGTYSRSNASESFAEQYAKYLLTGDASQQFLDLLSSKGLTKAQINKKWRDRYSAKSKAHSAFIDALSKFATDYGDGSTPNDPEESSDYGGRNTKYGSRSASKAARLAGYINNLPQTVDAIDDSTHHTIYRGNGDISGKSGWDLHNEFRVNVNPWYGFGIYGDGQYASNNESTARSFGPDAVAKLGLAKDANLAAYYGNSSRKPTTAKSKSEFDLEAFYRELRTEVFPEFVRNEIDPDLSDSQVDNMVRSIMGSIGLGGSSTMPQAAAAILAGWAGFDGLEIMISRDESYYVILNRGIVQMLVPKGYSS
jgi:hypothetical protein